MRGAFSSSSTNDALPRNPGLARLCTQNGSKGLGSVDSRIAAQESHGGRLRPLER